MTPSQPSRSELLDDLAATYGVERIHKDEVTAPMMAVGWMIGHSAAMERLRALERAGKLGPAVLRRLPNGRQVWAWGRPEKKGTHGRSR